MEYRKIINSLENMLIQSTKFTTKKWAEVNDGACGT